MDWEHLFEVSHCLTPLHLREDSALLPVRLKMHQECNWCAPAARGCGDQTMAGPKDTSLEYWWPPASHHQISLHSSVPATGTLVQQWHFHPFVYLQSPLEKKSTHPRACLWLSSNGAKQSSYRYCSWQSVGHLHLDQADFSSAELQWHSPGEWLSWHGLEHQRTALSPLLSGSGCPSWQLLASSCCIRGRSSQTCIHHSCTHQSFLDQEGTISHDIMNQGKLAVQCRRMKN